MFGLMNVAFVQNTTYWNLFVWNEGPVSYLNVLDLLVGITYSEDGNFSSLAQNSGFGPVQRTEVNGTS